MTFSLPGVSYTISNIKKVAICLLKFCQCNFLLVMDCTVLHIFESWWRGTARQTARQCNTLYNQKTRSAWRGSSDDMVTTLIFFTVICLTYNFYLIKCTLDKLPERSKIKKMLVPYSQLIWWVVNFVKNQKLY